MSDNAPARPFLDLIEATLKRQGKNKTWLAKRSNVSRATINNWGWQPRPPQAATVLAIADALGIDHEQALRLAGLSDDAPLPPVSELADLSTVPTRALVDLLHRAADELSRRPPA